MHVLVTYDVSTTDEHGRRRLRRIARICEDCGQRVQNSVFECDLEPAHWVRVRAKLVAEINPEEDSLRFYFLGANWDHRVEHAGAKPSQHPKDPLIL